MKNDVTYYNHEDNSMDDFCIAEALSHDIMSLELEEKESEIRKLEKQIDGLDYQLSQWIRIAGYWQAKCHKLKNSID